VNASEEKKIKKKLSGNKNKMHAIIILTRRKKERKRKKGRVKIIHPLRAYRFLFILIVNGQCFFLI
jgi:hypothetical protein